MSILNLEKINKILRDFTTHPAELRKALRRLTAENFVTLVLAVVQAVTATAFLHAEACGAQEVALWTGWNRGRQGLKKKELNRKKTLIWKNPKEQTAIEIYFFIFCNHLFLSSE